MDNTCKIALAEDAQKTNVSLELFVILFFFFSFTYFTNGSGVTHGQHLVIQHLQYVMWHYGQRSLEFKVPHFEVTNDVLYCMFQDIKLYFAVLKMVL